MPAGAGPEQSGLDAGQEQASPDIGPELTEPEAEVSLVDSDAPPPTPDSLPGWLSFYSAYGFRFRYPDTWTQEVVPNFVTLKSEPFVLGIAFHNKDETVDSPWTGMPAGDLEDRDAVTIMGEEGTKQALVHEGKVKMLIYRAEFGDLVLAIRVDDMSENVDYDQVEIPESIETEVDRIVESFIPAEEQ
jgi:hypothetical protein